MDHSPTRTEQDLIDELVSIYDFEFVPVRLTKTMLEKSIIDAGSSLRECLKRAGIVEYAAIPQGGANGVRQSMPVVTSEGTSERLASFYRPITKNGDPRFWIAGLRELAQPGNLLLVAFGPQSHLAILLSRDVTTISRQLAQFFPLRPDRGAVESVVRRLIARVKEVKALGWIATLRSGDTGVGFTLETMLGIAANTSQVADHEGIELKAHRLRARASDPLITLFAKTPDWGDLGGRAELVGRYGYYDEQRDRQALYCTITTKQNSLGWKLVVDSDLSRVRVVKGVETVVHYSFAVLRDRLMEKHPSTLFITVRARGTGAAEEFLYDSAVYCRQPSFADFLALVEEQAIGLDFTMHVKPDGTVRDHGYLWRIRESKIPELYAYRKQLL